MPIGSHDVTADEAQAIASAVQAVDGVSGMHSGAIGEVAMLFPGARVTGLRVRDEALQVHITADPAVVVTGKTSTNGDDIFADLADRVRTAVGDHWSGAVDVFVGDLKESPATESTDNADSDVSDSGPAGEIEYKGNEVGQ